MNKYLFVLCPPYSGSTVLWQVLRTSQQISALPREGQYLDPVKAIMRADPWNPDHTLPWPQIKEEWRKIWDTAKRVLLEKSPPNLIRAKAIADAFAPCWFIVMIRDPYAQCEGLARRRKRVFHASERTPSRERAMELCAERWTDFAERQIENIRTLERVVHFTYEELTDNTALVVDKLRCFMPELAEIDPTQKFRAHAATGKGSRVLTNLNGVKWRSLGRRNIEAINRVLSKRQDLLDFFGCRIKDPEPLQNLYSAVTRTKAFAQQIRSIGRDSAQQALRSVRRISRDSRALSRPG